MIEETTQVYRLKEFCKFLLEKLDWDDKAILLKAYDLGVLQKQPKKKESKGKWKRDVSSGYDGWRCTKCGYWIYEWNDFICDCDKETK